MSLEQYKDASRKELWEILQIQAEEFKKMKAEIIEEFAEASCMGDLAKIARGYGYDGADNQ